MAKVTIAAKHLLALCENALVELARKERYSTLSGHIQEIPPDSPESVREKIATITAVAERAVRLGGGPNASVTLEEREISGLEWALGI